MRGNPLPGALGIARVGPPEATGAPTNLTEVNTLQMIRPQGTLPRCPHSIYSPDERGTQAYSCRACFPVSPIVQREKLVIPNDSSTLLNRNDRPHANAHDSGSNECPSCGSRCHYDLGNGKVECADCGKVRKTRVRASEELELAEVI